MAKRHAVDNLEDSVAELASPSLKKTKIEETQDEDLPATSSPSTRLVANGHISNGGDAVPEATYGARVRKEDDVTVVGTLEGGEDDVEEEEEAPLIRQKAPAPGFTDLYLDTINRKRLDYDFEKLCSVTLSNHNVYGCLVCGKFYAGRGIKTPAYLHALDEDHHVYINLTTRKIYVLPEGYEVTSRTFDDIRYQVDPMYAMEEVRALDKGRKTVWDLDHKPYVPGFVGLNNMKAHDYFNVVVQALMHVAPLRNFFMLEDLSSRPQLAQRFSILTRRLWNFRAFKAHVSPHELIQEVGVRSGRRFVLTDQSDPADFMSWFLNNLHLSVGGSRTKQGSSIVQKIFQGQLKIESQRITALADVTDRLLFEDAEIKTTYSPFMILTLDLPPAPLFLDVVENSIIPQVPLARVLQKYNGQKAQEQGENRVRYRLQHPLPPYLLMHVKRFKTNKFLQTERNPTIVTFNPRGLNMLPFVEPNPQLYPQKDPILYDLVANVTLESVKMREDSVEGEERRKEWLVQLREGLAGEHWWQIQDLDVREIQEDLLCSKESYIMVWEKRKGQGKAPAR